MRAIPNPLYTYKPINTNTYHQILYSYLWASSPKEFNDTFDCALNYQIIPKVIDMAIQQNKDINPKKVSEDEKQKIMDEIIKRQRIVSFTDKVSNPTMWSHYAAKYEGICIGWNIEKIKKNIHRVRYTEDPYELLILDSQDYKEKSRKVRETSFASIARLKLKTWEYENEYRYVILDAENVVDKIPCLIESITFGLKTKDNEKDIIKYLVSTGENAKSKINLYQLRQDNKKLTLFRDLLQI